MSSAKSASPPATTPNTGDSFKCGFLNKMGTFMWNRRWCVLQNDFLAIFKTYQEKSPSQVMNLTKYRFESANISGKKFCFYLRSKTEPTKYFTFQADCQSAYDSWQQFMESRTKKQMGPGKDEENGGDVLGQGPSKFSWTVSALWAEPVKESKLFVMSHGVLKSLKRRYFVLHPDIVLQFRNTQAEAMMSAIPLMNLAIDDVDVISDADIYHDQLPIAYSVSGLIYPLSVRHQEIPPTHKKLWWFRLRCASLSRIFEFASESLDVRDDWVYALKSCVEGLLMTSEEIRTPREASPISAPKSLVKARSKSQNTPVPITTQLNQELQSSTKEPTTPTLLAQQISPPDTPNPVPTSPHDEVESCTSSDTTSSSLQSEGFIGRPMSSHFDFSDNAVFTKASVGRSQTVSHTTSPLQNMNHSLYIKIKDVNIQRKIGSGATGKVYIGQYKGADVAIKKFASRRMKAADLKRFNAEVEICYKLEHPNIVRFIGASTEVPDLFIVMEYVHKGSLSDILVNHEGNLEWSRRLQMAIDVAKGMAYVHGQGVLHRDLKSSNLLVDRNWVTKISDFGVARVFVDQYNSMTQIGSPCWMAPEVIRGDPYGKPADVYSFSVVLWEIWARSVPYEGMNGMQVSYKVVMEQLRPEVPPKPRAKSSLPKSPSDDLDIVDLEAVEIPDDIDVTGGNGFTSPSPTLESPKSIAGNLDGQATDEPPHGWSELMVKAWDDSPENRPSFVEITHELKKMMVECSALC